MSDKRCSLLWNHVRIHVDGVILPCCRFNQFAVTEEYAPLPKLEDGIDAGFNSQLFNKLREDMSSGIEPEPCKDCYNTERFGNESMRTWFNKTYKSENKKIRYIETALSRHCNLACRMCNDRFSSKWFQYLHPGEKVNVDNGSKILDYYDGDLSELDHIKFVGGEPLLEKNHVPFLIKLFEKSNKPENISLLYNTNGTVKPKEQVIDFWKRAAKIKIIFSIDGIGEVNEILRPPHKWQTIIDNIEYIKSLKDVNLEFDMHSVISILNVKHFPSLVEFSFKNFNKIPSFALLDYPEHLSLFHQTPDVKNDIKNFVIQNYKNIDEFGGSYVDHLVSKLDETRQPEYTLEDVKEIEGNRHFFTNKIDSLLL